MLVKGDRASQAYPPGAGTLGRAITFGRSAHGIRKAYRAGVSCSRAILAP
ncbi:hypothetical protein AVDCRST_MAG84-1780 [uncultured Microcoleus sp.]|uniref:Uncharacterized protein n=1 Tax=uncultured Microcoleus sp. TaxID=259945 RepID=A0A6J4LBT3_9CYAN|nr:hypothetical protein AVDCRST_MAG84-1780 [uncultured Microcoleus sp.]